MEEKQKLLNKMFKYQLEGYKFNKCFTLDDDIEEMKFHLQVIEQTRQKEMEKYKLSKEQTEFFVNIYNKLHKHEISHITDEKEREEVSKILGLTFHVFKEICKKLK